MSSRTHLDAQKTRGKLRDSDSRFGGGNSHNWEVVQWLKESQDEDYRWVWQRIWAGGQGKPEAKQGALDASDACMGYWLLTGDEDGDFLKLQEMMGDDWDTTRNPSVP